MEEIAVVAVIQVEMCSRQANGKRGLSCVKGCFLQYNSFPRLSSVSLFVPNTFFFHDARVRMLLGCEGARVCVVLGCVYIRGGYGMESEGKSVEREWREGGERGRREKVNMNEQSTLSCTRPPPPSPPPLSDMSVLPVSCVPANTPLYASNGGSHASTTTKSDTTKISNDLIVCGWVPCVCAWGWWAGGWRGKRGKRGKRNSRKLVPLPDSFFCGVSLAVLLRSLAFFLTVFGLTAPFFFLFLDFVATDAARPASLPTWWWRRTNELRRSTGHQPQP